VKGLSKYEYVKRWRKKNKDKVAAQSKRRFERKREHIYAQQKAWRDANIEHVRALDAERHRMARKNNPEAQRARMKRFKAKRDARLVATAGRPRSEACELCLEPAKTVFDHCHASGNFRGWLCDRCNRTLGQVKDSVGLLKRMIYYLENGGVHGKADSRAA